MVPVRNFIPSFDAGQYDEQLYNTLSVKFCFIKDIIQILRKSITHCRNKQSALNQQIYVQVQEVILRCNIIQT